MTPIACKICASGLTYQGRGRMPLYCFECQERRAAEKKANQIGIVRERQCRTCNTTYVAGSKKTLCDACLKAVRDARAKTPYVKQQKAAYLVYRRALRDGTLVRPSACSRCRRTDRKIHGHHRSYARPLDVLWLCHQCHKFRHCFDERSVQAADRMAA